LDLLIKLGIVVAMAGGMAVKSYILKDRLSLRASPRILLHPLLK
jgi:hypothetical protein